MKEREYSRRLQGETSSLEAAYYITWRVPSVLQIFPLLLVPELNYLFHLGVAIWLGTGQRIRSEMMRVFSSRSGP